MSFSADWLTLRSDADRSARAPELAAELAELVETCIPLRVLDLGAGTGANMAAIAPVLGPDQHWVLVDSDAGLLEATEVPDGISAETHVADLASDLVPFFDPMPDLVTASAFFDLAGREWAERLVARVSACNALFYTVLTYDGRETWVPENDLDQEVLKAFHKDQRRDKGLGPALGPDATRVLSELFIAEGYRVEIAPSDWTLTSEEDAPLIAALASGAAEAVTEALGVKAQSWLDARRDAHSVMIGHMDLLAVPPEWPRPAEV